MPRLLKPVKIRILSLVPLSKCFKASELYKLVFILKSPYEYPKICCDCELWWWGFPNWYNSAGNFLSASDDVSLYTWRHYLNTEGNLLDSASNISTVSKWSGNFCSTSNRMVKENHCYSPVIWFRSLFFLYIIVHV